MENKLENIKSNVSFDEGKHVYFYQGNQFPSVTTIIKRMYPMPKDIDQNILDYAVARGNYVHTWLEDKYTGQDNLSKFKMESNYSEEDFSRWEWLAKNGYRELERIYPDKDFTVLEVPMAHPELKYAGMFDLIFQYGQKIVLVDFKTSTYMDRYNNWEKVQMQLAAYALILKDVYGIEVEQFEVLHMTHRGISLLKANPDYEGFKKALEMEDPE